MDLSVRKQQQQQQSPTPSSRPILNPPVPGTTDRNSSHLSSSVSTHNSIKQQSHQYIPVPSIAQQQQRVIHQTKYVQLLNVIEEMGKDIKPTYAGNKNSAERLRRAIASARILVRECQLECDRNNRS